MKLVAKVSLGVLGTVIAVVGIGGLFIYGELSKAFSEDPTVYNEDVQDLVEATRARGPLERAVLFTGSSSIRFWTTLEEDMQPLVTIRHGFGGSKLGDIEYFAESLINEFEPRAVVVFAGTNDIQPGRLKTPEVLLATYQRLVARVRADLPNAPIYYIGITPSPLRVGVWDVSVTTNRLIREFTETDSSLHYIETGHRLMDASGVPDGDNYRWDRLHLSERGYEIWTEIIRTRLMDELGV